MTSLSGRVHNGGRICDRGVHIWKEAWKFVLEFFFEGADFKNSGNHYVTPMVPAKNVQFKMAPINHVIVHKSAVYEPITAMLVSISMFLRSVNATKHIYIKGRLPAKKKSK